MKNSFTPDPWQGLREFTTARLALGRAGSSVPTYELLNFQMHHARAIDAVYTEFDRKSFATSFSAHDLDTLSLNTRAETREEYLLRPDYGRRLSDESRSDLQALADSKGPKDVLLMLVDGLSATALHRNASPVVLGLVERLHASGFSVGTIPLVRYGRVALQDEVGSILDAKVVVSLIGERPGLGSPDSLGAYLVFNPRLGNTDANRNCVSNIRPEGLSHEAAVETIHWLITEAIRRKISGVQLKDDRTLNIGGPARDATPKLS